ncbi:hypothetical protein PoB_000312900 [Plakobranchus ocellatus]|uniref:Uncharacterized protein n=1 Tax=Plakobranchus ocellatus TaxID=259542 RepID=A0AAV3Y325_9GAST|nr:hypothetical protein PoB_000312900 [Plakobranchus ocellatus]
MQVAHFFSILQCSFFLLGIFNATQKTEGEIEQAVTEDSSFLGRDKEATFYRLFRNTCGCIWQEALEDDGLHKDHFAAGRRDRTLCCFLRDSIYLSPEQAFRQVGEQATRLVDDEKDRIETAALTATPVRLTQTSASDESKLETTFTSILGKMEQLLARQLISHR